MQILARGYFALCLNCAALYVASYLGVKLRFCPQLNGKRRGSAFGGPIGWTGCIADGQSLSDSVPIVVLGAVYSALLALLIAETNGPRGLTIRLFAILLNYDG
jgi:hypothetical protein